MARFNLFDELYQPFFKSFFNEIYRYKDVTDNVEKYVKDGMLHREDGPAVIRKDGDKKIEEYWLFGEKLTKREWELKVEQINDEKLHTIYVDDHPYTVKGKRYRDILKLLQE